MREFILILFCTTLVFTINNALFASTITGQVNKNETLSTIVDKETGIGLANVKIEIPKLNYTTYTDENGNFQLNASIDKPLILSVTKEGYRPFSITIDKSYLNDPLKIGIEKNKLGDMLITNEIYHLGDNIFSTESANCSQFKVKSIGPSYTKTVTLKPLKDGQSADIVIGSIIGLDTIMAKSMGQNNIEYAYSSPSEIYFNGQKIYELQINGDNITVPIPRQLIKSINKITIKTGHNLFQTKYIDYDDIEIMNISIQVNNKYGLAEK